MNIKKQLDNRTDLQDYLFRRGFLVSEEEFNMSIFPFYGNWNTVKLGDYYFMTHNLTKVHYVEKSGVTHFLLGHCYNPFTMEHEEVKQLQKIADAYEIGKEAYWEAVDELTGVFVMGYFDKKGISFITDPSGMQSAYYGVVENNFMITSHPQIIGDLYSLEMDEFVKELIAYKWYGRVMGAYLPVDLSAFKEVKRVVPNIEFIYSDNKISTKRFYPLRDLAECKTDAEYNEVIVKAATILKNNAELILKKWDTPAISLTGGIDSNTTFAACNNLYDKYETFSYLSAHKETIDVEAAKKIAERFNTKHTIYEIPKDNSTIKDFELKRAIINHNSGYIAPRKENEVRKRIYLEENCPNDIEIKSWVSETIRGYWYKHYGRTSMPKLSPKLYRNLYKIFITNRTLAHKVDKLFAVYIDKFEYAKIPAQYPPADMHYNEVTWGSWGGTNITEMKYCFDITILYNNRVFLDTLFKVPLKDRISDQHHLDMKKYLNKELYDMNIRVVNMMETKNRARMLNVIFTTNMKLPF